MTNKPIRVGVIGAGVGRIHVSSYQMLDNVQAVALCDVDETRLNEVADTLNVPRRYTNAAEMFTSGEIDAVSICTPNNLHAPLAVAALEAGLHVLCEKPLAHTVTDGQKIVEAARTAPGKLMVCYNRRYRPDIQWLRRLMQAKKLGRIYQVKTGWIREDGIPAGWFAHKERSGGGPLVDLGVHILDAVMWLLDFPEPLTISGDVQANFGPHGSKVHNSKWRRDPLTRFTVEDSATAFIRLAGGINLMFETNWAAHARPGQDDIYLTMLGTAGTADIYIKNYARRETMTLYTELNGLPVTIKPDTHGPPHDHELAVAEFIRCLREDTTPEASAERGLIVLRMIEAIYRSAEVGREVEFVLK